MSTETQYSSSISEIMKLRKSIALIKQNQSYIKTVAITLGDYTA